MGNAPQDSRQAKIAAAQGKQGGSRVMLAAIVGIVVVLAVIAAIWFAGRGGDEAGPGAPSGSGATTSGAVKLPKGVKDANAPIVASGGGALKEGVPTLQIFEDFQCPICKQVEEQLGGKIKDLADAGKINVVYYTKTFMDDNLRNDSSMKVGNAAACAADAGRFEAYHDKIYAKQPAEEGKGYSDADVQAAATEAGLAGAELETWKQCVSGKTYQPYLKGIEEYTAKTMQITGTPAFYVNGKKLPLTNGMTPEAFEKALFDTAK